MISVGIDVSKGKSTVCILKPYGEIMCSPFEMLHGEKELNALDAVSYTHLDVYKRQHLYRPDGYIHHNDYR